MGLKHSVMGLSPSWPQCGYATTTYAFAAAVSVNEEIYNKYYCNGKYQQTVVS